MQSGGACPSHFALPAVSQNAHPGAGMALIEYFTAAKSNIKNLFSDHELLEGCV